MTYTLRPYQQEAVNIAVEWAKDNSDPAVLNLSGGAGKSLICAEIARIIYNKSKKRVLILVPNQDLLLQNGEKMEMTGEKFSYFSASVSKSLRHHIVLATEGTFKSIASERGGEFSLVIVDEAHRVTPTFIQIIADMRAQNPLLRVIGLTGTPYRAQSGHIYQQDTNGRIEQEAKDPFYTKLLYKITCNELIAMGYLTPVVIGISNSAYDTRSLQLKGDDFTDSQLKKAFEANSITEKVVADIVEKTQDRKGVIIFAATLKHADEIMGLLPQGEACFLHGKLDKAARRKLISDFKAQKFKYLVNKDIASTGFDAPHADACVFMRAIGSNGLFQQMIWRVVRLAPNKKDALLLDYGNNIKNLFDGSDDIFTPKIKAYGKSSQPQIEVSCPDCGTAQEFSKRQGYEKWDEFGYAADGAGYRLVDNIPAHHGRRCTAVTALGKNQYKRCDYYWTHKECPECGHKNDIAARGCESCGTVLIDPTAKLSETATVIPVGEKSTTLVNKMSVKESTDGTVINVLFDTTHGEIKCRFFPRHNSFFVAQQGIIFERATDCGDNTPKYIEYTKQKNGLCSINRYLWNDYLI